MSEMYTMPDDKAALSGRAASTSIATASSGRRCPAAAASRASTAASARCFNGPTTVDGQQCREGWTFYPLKAARR